MDIKTEKLTDDWEQRLDERFDALEACMNRNFNRVRFWLTLAIIIAFALVVVFVKLL